MCAAVPTAQDAGTQRGTPGASPTFSRDVAPIVFANCAPCHRPGESGPFDLLSYSDVRARGRIVAEVVRSRYMPPWKPSQGGDGGGPFAGTRRLTDAQVATIVRWV